MLTLSRGCLASLAIAVFLAGCAEDAPVLPAPAKGAWALDVEAQSGASAVRDGDAILLSAPASVASDCAYGSCGNARAILGGVVTGDFTARFTFERFAGDGVVSGFVAGAEPETFDRDRPVAEGQLTGLAAIPNVSVAFSGVPGGYQQHAHGAEGDAGWVEIRRRGSEVSVESHAGGHSVQASQLFGAGDVILGVTLRGASEGEATTARFTGFALSR